MNFKEYTVYIVLMLLICTFVASVFGAAYSAHFNLWFTPAAIVMAVVSGIVGVVFALCKWASS